METGELDDDFYKLHRFRPSMEDAVTYFLPRLLAGSPLPHGADGLIRRADVYACEPKDLAAEYAPVPSAVSTGDRFFFTTCMHKSAKDARIARSAGAGTWAVQRTENVYREGVKVGELKHLSFKKSKASTGWVMEEYRCLLPEALVADGEKVFCKIHLAPNACAAARQESAAYKLRQQVAPTPQADEPVTVITASAHAKKRPAPVAAAAADPPCSKKMRMAAPVPVPVPVPEPEEEYEDCPMWFTPPAPVSLPAASTEVPDAPEADDDDMGRLSCTIEEFLGVQQMQNLPVEAENNLEHLVFDQDIDLLAASESLDPRSLWAYDAGEETVGATAQEEEEEEQTLPTEADNSIENLDMEGYQQMMALFDWKSDEVQFVLADGEKEAGIQMKRCDYNAAAANLQSIQGQHSHFFSFGAVN